MNIDADDDKTAEPCEEIDDFDKAVDEEIVEEEETYDDRDD